MKRSEVSFFSWRRPAWSGAAAFALAWAGLGTPVAGAQEPGVVYEPGSPSYKEYSIPLEEARRDAGGGIRASIDSRAFGIGLNRQGRGGGSPTAGEGRKGDARRGGRSAGGQTEAKGGVESRGLTERLADAEAAGAPAFWRLAPMLLVLIPGILIGVLLARRAELAG